MEDDHDVVLHKLYCTAPEAVKSELPKFKPVTVTLWPAEMAKFAVFTPDTATASNEKMAFCVAAIALTVTTASTA